MIPGLDFGGFGGGLTANASSGVSSSDVFAPNISAGGGNAVPDSFWSKPVFSRGGGLDFALPTPGLNADNALLIGGGVVALVLVLAMVKRG